MERIKIGSLSAFLQGLGTLLIGGSAFWGALHANELFEKVLEIRQGIAELKQGEAKLENGVEAIKAFLKIPVANSIAQAPQKELGDIIAKIPSCVSSGIYLDIDRQALIKSLQDKTVEQRESILQGALKYKLPSEKGECTQPKNQNR